MTRATAYWTALTALSLRVPSPEPSAMFPEVKLRSPRNSRTVAQSRKTRRGTLSWDLARYVMGLDHFLGPVTAAHETNSSTLLYSLPAILQVSRLPTLQYPRVSFGESSRSRRDNSFA